MAKAKRLERDKTGFAPDFNAPYNMPRMTMTKMMDRNQAGVSYDLMDGYDTAAGQKARADKSQRLFLEQMLKV